MRVIAGTARSIPLKSRDGLDTRPTGDRVKVAIFNIVQFDVPGSRVLDLFGGSGQMAIEALSRGASGAVIVDASLEAVEIIRENLNRTKLAPLAKTVRADYLDYLNTCRDRFDLIFLDPPYRENFLENALKRISEIDILKSGGIIICEKPAGKMLDEAYGGILHTKDYRYGKTEISLFRREEASLI